MWTARSRFAGGAPARVDSVIDLNGGYVVPPFGEAHTITLVALQHLPKRRSTCVTVDRIAVEREVSALIARNENDGRNLSL
jgi:predicted amidohydrolase YtcJ